jgi:malate dehydrogenase (oxaloacetate-decarboxylating)
MTTTTDGCSLRTKHRGLIGIKPKLPIRDSKTLSWVYTPGVAKPCLEIEKDHLTSFDYTMRGNTIAIISDGSSVYGLGNIGPTAALPMLEAKSAIHKNFAGIDALPIALDTQDVDEIVETIRYLSPTFGGIHLEDISAPRCFAIAERLKRAVSLPVLHADQHASATAVMAALLNAAKIVDKKPENMSVVINGAGAAGLATAKMLKIWGVGDVKVLDHHGAIFYRRTIGLNYVKSEIARLTNPEDKKGDLATMLHGADVFVGFSSSGLLTPEMIGTMAKDPIVFALALPEPEISYQAAKDAGARVVATSLSNSPNTLDSSLVIPGIFRGALDVRANDINHEMLRAAAQAMADLVNQEELGQGLILPQPLDFRTSAKIARAVAESAIGTGVAQLILDPSTVEDKVMRYVYEGSEAWIEPEEVLDDRSNETGSGDEGIDAISLRNHKRYHGVIETVSYVPIRDQYIYDLVYSQPEAARPCEMIRDEPDLAYDMTLKNNLVGVVTDGSAVLGLGNIGPGAGLPVMEGKAVLFKTFGGVEAFPICVRTQSVEEIIAIVKRIAPGFGGINLEDISAPRCFEIEKRLSDELDIPVFHDDQHGTAVVVLAALFNAIKIAEKPINELSIIVNGAGAASLSVSKLLLKAGVKDIIICDTSGVIYKGRTKGMNDFKHAIAEITNLRGAQGSLTEVMKGADMFIGLSAPGMVNAEMVRSMAPNPIIFALANPVPEIMPDEALAAGAKVMATGRSDLPNQVNNSLAFPGIFRGALDVRASEINDDMKIAAAEAIASLIDPATLSEGTIIPSALDFRVPPAVASAVAAAAIKTGVARKTMSPEAVASQLNRYITEGQLAPSA